MADGPARIAEASGGSVTLARVPLAQVDLRLDPSLADRGPFPLPLEPNTAWEEGPRAVLWLGPDEWLVLGPPGSGAEIAAELERSLEGTHRSIVDVGANRVAFELGGPHRRDLLPHGCALDLHPRVWRTGMCAQTLLAKAQVILHERTDATRVFVRPSFAGYVLDWLVAAASTMDRV